MKVKAITKFMDKKAGKVRHVGDVFAVSKERYDEILKVGKLVEEVKEEAKKG